ncbi:DNA polymerase III delta subunit [Mesorhizobium sp. J18]|uniref:DNA polymerase III subunit delta n=1 Tax=Mesorhizobium sp. J18 TaxID=935263 RepID=UPI001198DD9D|nr:DNA polymerase III subunit delta [Mesorhizobium sp. J18]TWG88996.1 DNA polymerase III delta subunit [Mesorhizobium sp. J18]
MAQKKAHEVEAWLKRPDDRMRVVLVYGPDRGLVSERARRFAEKAGVSLDDPFSTVRLDASECEQQPGRLLDEALTVPMFSDRRLVWVRGAANQKAVASEIAILAAEPPADALILVEAGDLRKGSALRSAVEKAGAAIALPCYADDGRDIDAVIDDELGKAGLGITLEARQMLKTSLGGDRLATRGELEKLALYCMGKNSVEVEDVQTLTGDVSGLGADEAVDAILTGKPAEFDRIYARLLAGGSQPFLILSAAMRQFQAIQLMRQSMEKKGLSASAAVNGARPPIFFARKRFVETALQRWSSDALAGALERLQRAVLRTRQRPEVAGSLARQVLLGLTLERARAG